jgi:mutator family transposase
MLRRTGFVAPDATNATRLVVERSVSETLTYYAFPHIHWQKIRTNNPLERIMREIRRRTRVVGAFPDGQSCLNLAAARLRYIVGTAWSTKCYVNMRPLYGARLASGQNLVDELCSAQDQARTSKPGESAKD